MRVVLSRLWTVLLALVLLSAIALGQQNDAKAQIEAFNHEFTAAVLRMDNAAISAMWAEDGTTLLPGMAPLSGRANIAKWMDDITAKMPGYRVTKQEDSFHDIQVSGDWASEWGTTYQVVQPPDGKPPIETHGKILLVLHRGSDGKWRIQQEMWTPGPRT